MITAPRNRPTNCRGNCASYSDSLSTDPRQRPKSLKHREKAQIHTVIVPTYIASGGSTRIVPAFVFQALEDGFDLQAVYSPSDMATRRTHANANLHRG